MLLALVVIDIGLVLLALGTLLRRARTRYWLAHWRALPEHLGGAVGYRPFRPIIAGVIFFIFASHAGISTYHILSNHGPNDTVAITVDKFGQGTIESSLVELNCPASCHSVTADVQPGKGVSLTAKPEDGAYVIWSGCDGPDGDTCAVTVGEDMTVLATFATEVQLAPGVELGKTVVQLDDMTELSGQGRLVISGSAATLKKGYFIVGGKEPGFFRKVANVTPMGTKIVVETTDASLEDIIESGTVVISSEDLPAIPSDDDDDLLANPSREDAPDGGGLCDIQERRCEITFSKTIAGAEISGEVSFSFDLNVAVDYGFRGIDEVRAVAEFRAKAEIDVDASAEIKELETEPLEVASVPFPLFVGGIRIPAQLEISLLIGIEEASVEARVEASAETYAKLGVHYEDGNWELIREYSKPTFAYDPDMHGEVKAFAEPILTLNIAGVGGPSFSVRGDVELDVHPSSASRWQLYWGLTATTGVHIKFFALSLVKETAVWNKFWSFAEGPRVSATPTPTGSATPTPTGSATPTPTGSAAPTPTGTSPPRLGDVDCDTSVTTQDADKVLELTRTGNPPSSLPCPANADVDCNAAINAIDAELILQFADGLVAKFACEEGG